MENTKMTCPDMESFPRHTGKLEKQGAEPDAKLAA